MSPRIRSMLCDAARSGRYARTSNTGDSRKRCDRYVTRSSVDAEECCTSSSTTHTGLSYAAASITADTPSNRRNRPVSSSSGETDGKSNESRNSGSRRAASAKRCRLAPDTPAARTIGLSASAIEAYEITPPPAASRPRRIKKPPRSRARSMNSPSSRDLPIPPSPSTSNVPPRPVRRRESAPSSREISDSRPTNVGSAVRSPYEAGKRA